MYKNEKLKKKKCISNRNNFTQAHFDYKDMCHRLKLVIKQRRLEEENEPKYIKKEHHLKKYEEIKEILNLSNRSNKPLNQALKLPEIKQIQKTRNSYRMILTTVFTEPQNYYLCPSKTDNYKVLSNKAIKNSIINKFISKQQTIVK
jgi:hypothetical protein